MGAVPTFGVEPESVQRHRSGTAVLAKGRDRIEKILDAATRLLIDEGYAQLSTRKIAARAGIRPGHLQYYFPTKQAVVRGLLERYLERATRSFDGRTSDLDTVLDGILSEQTTGDSARFFWELWALAARDPAVAEAMRVFYRGYWRNLVDALLAAEPALGRPRAERRAALMVAMLEGLTLFRSRTDQALPLPFLERELRGLARKLATDPD